MSGNKQYLEAIRALPEEWVADDTNVMSYYHRVVVAYNPKLGTMLYVPATGTWAKVKPQAIKAKIKREGG